MEDQEKEKARRKWQSRKWIVCLWAMALDTVVLILGIVFKMPEIMPICYILTPIPAAYVGANVLQKKIEKGVQNGSC